MESKKLEQYKDALYAEMRERKAKGETRSKTKTSSAAMIIKAHGK